MKFRLVCTFVCLVAVIQAQSVTGKPTTEKSPAPVLDERWRLMQEYMMQREELIALRRAALEKAKDAKSTEEKKQHLDKLAADEKPLRDRVNAASRAYRAVEKTRRDELQQSKPRS